MNEKQLDTELLPYPLPPWKHRFRTLSIFCEVDEAALAAPACRRRWSLHPTSCRSP